MKPLPESPVWDPVTQELHWVDLRNALLHTTRWNGPTRTFDLSAHASVLGTIVAHATGHLIAALDGSLATVTAQGEVSPLVSLEDDPALRLNDGACDPSGRLWVGSMARDATPGAGSLFRVTPHGITRVLTGLTVPNGLGWSPDGRTMYVTDTGPRTITAYDYDASTGTLTAPRTFVTLTEGKPDGLTVDAEGHLWIASWNGAQVLRYSATGALDRAVDVPAPEVTACTFAGPALSTLAVTMTAPAALHLAETPTQGQPPTAYEGLLP